MKVVTCAATAGASTKYAKSLAALKGHESLYDVINVHSYAQVEGWPTWRRTYPEDASVAYLTRIQQAIKWRDKNAPGKEVWVTEFGWDACSKQPPAGSKWVDVSDTAQAQYLVRSFLIFSTMDLARAYIYFFNDEDKPSVHGSSGLTRNYTPKPSYRAVSHLFATLGEYRLRRVVQRDSWLYDLEFQRGSDAKKLMRVLWVPTRDGNSRKVSIKIDPTATPGQARRMPLTTMGAAVVPVTDLGGTVQLKVSGSPTYLPVTMP